jgi:hypothetical protein
MQCFSRGRIMPWQSGRSQGQGLSPFQRLALQRAAAAARERVRIEGLTVADDARPKALAVVTVSSTRWVWLPRSAIDRHDDGSITMPLAMAKTKGLLPADASATVIGR